MEYGAGIAPYLIGAGIMNIAPHRGQSDCCPAWDSSPESRCPRGH